MHSIFSLSPLPGALLIGPMFVWIVDAGLKHTSRQLLGLTLMAVFGGWLTSNLPAYAEDALDRFKFERLQAVHQAVEKLKNERRQLAAPGPWTDYRANLHVHSAFSHDSRGQIDDIVAAAKRVGTQVIMFTEHPADHYDFYSDGHQGLHDGVLLIPGAELLSLIHISEPTTPY